MFLATQNHLKFPRNLRRSEVQDWYFSHSGKRKFEVISRRFVLAGIAAAPIGFAAPGNGFRQGQWLPRAEAQGFVALIALLISALDLADRVVKFGKDLEGTLKLDNRASSESTEGSTLAAVYDENEYVESVAQAGTGLLSFHPQYASRPRVRADGSVYDYQSVVPPEVEFSLDVEMPVTRPGDKQFEAMTALSIENREFRVA